MKRKVENKYILSLIEKELGCIENIEKMTSPQDIELWAINTNFKETVSRDFRFFPAPEYPISTVSMFFENSRGYSQLNVHHRCR